MSFVRSSMQTSPHPLFMLLSRSLPDTPPFASTTDVGAIVRFEGVVRDNNEGKTVVELEYTAYPALAEREGTRIGQESIERFGLLAACCMHRVGLLHPGDVAVRVWAAAAHRGESFRACESIIDAVKASVPIWKREVYSNGDRAWVTCQGDGSGPGHHRRQHGPPW